jgi:hypothetical protein
MRYADRVVFSSCRSSAEMRWVRWDRGCAGWSDPVTSDRRLNPFRDPTPFRSRTQTENGPPREETRRGLL